MQSNCFFKSSKQRWLSKEDYEFSVYDTFTLAAVGEQAPSGAASPLPRPLGGPEVSGQITSWTSSLQETFSSRRSWTKMLFGYRRLRARVPAI